MSQEIELKFEIDSSTIIPLSNFLSMHYVAHSEHLQLTNTYYDSKENILRQIGSSVRIRGTASLGQAAQYEITVKSAGSAVAGLHTRQEINASLPNDQLNLTVLPPNIFPPHINIIDLASQLTPQFTTNFDRHTWLINYSNSVIEIALDQGKITYLNTQLPILEVELELKSGSQLDLVLFAIELSQFHVHLFSQSKAARGYRLINNGQLKKIDIMVNSDSLSLSHLPQWLDYWQANEEYALANDDPIFYQTVLDAIAIYLKKILPVINYQYSQQLDELYLNWYLQSQHFDNIKNFAYSELNTKLKLYLILLISS